MATSDADARPAASPKMVAVEDAAGVVFPSNLRCALRVNVPVEEAVADPGDGEDRSLSAYMRLPVDQYVGIQLPMGATMRRVPGDPDLFQLEIPGLKFLSLEVRPVVRVRVRLVPDGDAASTWTGQSGRPGGKTPEWRAEEKRRIEEAEEALAAFEAACEDDDQTRVPEACDDAMPGEEGTLEDDDDDDDDAREGGPPVVPKPTPLGRPEREDVALRGPCVLIEAVSCRVEGETVEELGVNDLFVFRGTTCFRWASRGDDSRGRALTREGTTAKGSEEEGSEPAEVGGWATAPEVGVSFEADGGAGISGWADIGVGVDPPGPFALLPNAFAEKVGDAVMRTTLKALQTVFLRGLGEDYRKWATDAEYRAAREKAAKEAAAEMNRA